MDLRGAFFLPVHHGSLELISRVEFLENYRGTITNYVADGLFHVPGFSLLSGYLMRVKPHRLLGRVNCDNTIKHGVLFESRCDELRTRRLLRGSSLKYPRDLPQQAIMNYVLIYAESDFAGIRWPLPLVTLDLGWYFSYDLLC